MGHGDDLGFLFPMAHIGFPPSVVTPAQQKTRQNLLNLLETFAKSGRPTSGELEEWSAVSGSSAQYLDVGERLGMARDLAIASQLLFWRGVRAAARAAAPPLASHPPDTLHAKIAHKRQT